MLRGPLGLPTWPPKEDARARSSVCAPGPAATLEVDHAGAADAHQIEQTDVVTRTTVFGIGQQIHAPGPTGAESGVAADHALARAARGGPSARLAAQAASPAVFDVRARVHATTREHSS